MKKLRYIILILLLGFAYWHLQQSPAHNLLKGFPSGVAIYDRNKNLLRISLSEDQKYRLIKPYQDFPLALKQATISYEDKDFYHHHGVDLAALFRAAYQTYIKGDRKVGASTITMQLARLKWQINSSAPLGKLKQIFRAIQLEAQYSKQAILEAYLNLAPYGGNIEGAHAASLIYFGKPVSELNQLEAISLAVIPQNPNARMPEHQANQRVIRKAAKRLYGNAPALFEDLSPDSLNLILSYKTRKEVPFEAPHFTQYVLSSVLGKQQSDAITSLDLNKQKHLENVLKKRIAQTAEFGINNASAVLLNHRTMEVEAMLGSADFLNKHIEGQVNGTIAKRSPGSTLKPLLFALGFDAGLIHPHTLLKDLPARYLGFSPENADSLYIGPISASDALLSSRNVPAVELQKQLLQFPEFDFYNALDAYGIDLRPRGYYGLALSLGGMEISMLELLKIYASFANGGHIKEIKTLTQKATQQATQLSTQQNNEALARIFSKEASFMLLSTLAKHKRPGAYQSHSNRFVAKLNSVPDIAWKTGTSWGFRDAWAVGISGDYILAVWVGNFDGKANPSFKGFEAAGPILFDMFDKLVQVDEIDSGWRIENAFRHLKGSVKTVSVCQKTGDLNEQGCPKQIDTLFIPGKSPIKNANVFRPINIDIETGLRACDEFSGRKKTQYFEVWPNDIRANFESAGINTRNIPDYHPTCKAHAFENTINLLSAPKITSPANGQTFVIRLQNSSETQSKIALKATVDGATKRLNWFVDGKFIGSVKPQETLFYTPTAGEKMISLSDDQGQVVSTKITVEAI